MATTELDVKDGGMWPLAKQVNQATPLQPVASPGYGGAGRLELNVGTLLYIFWLWRWLLIGAAALGIAGGVITTLMTTPLYRSTATLELNPPVVEVIDGEKSGRSAASDYEFLPTQYGLLESRALAERVAQDLNLASDASLVSQDQSREARQNQAVAIVSGGLTVEPTERSRLVNISFSSPDPVLASRIVNGFAESFINSSLERRYQASSYARDFLQRQIVILRQQLEDSERQLVSYAQREGIITTAGSAGAGGGSGIATNVEAGSPTAQSLSAMTDALASATARRIAAEQKVRQAAPGSAAEVSERTAQLRSQIAGLRAQYQEKSAVFQPDYPEMVRLQSQIQSLEQAAAGEASNVRSGRTSTLQAEYQASLAEERAISGQVQRLRGEMLNLRGRSIQYNILQREVDTNRALYDALLQRYKEIGVAGGIGTSQASIVDRGQPPSAPYKPNLMLNLLMGLALGLAAGMGLALVLEFINDTIKTPDDVREKLQLAFLGGIPAAKNRKVVDELTDQTSPVSEAYFSAMTALQFTTESGAPKVLVLTSTRPAEGKSTSAWALAGSFSRLGKSVLLIDADMRKPAFVTGAEKTDGLAVLLTNRDPLRDHLVKPEASENVWLLQCGPLPPNPAELLASARFEALLLEATAEFDMVIIDSPPILGLADTPLLASKATATLMVIEAGKTRTRAAGEAVGRLRQAGANVVGALLTRYKPEAAGYGYGYGYGYGAYKYSSLEGREREIRLIVGKE